MKEERSGSMVAVGSQGVPVAKPLGIIDVLTPEAVEARLKKQAELRGAFLRHIRRTMKKDLHYMPSARRGALPYILQPGALLLKDFFETSDDYEVVRETLEDDFTAVTVKCTLRHPSGMVYTGIGSANSAEYNFQAKVQESTQKALERNGSKMSPEEIRAAFFWTQHQVVVQMARKRALVSASRHLPFVSELFAPEGEDENGQRKPAGVARDSKEAVKVKYDHRLRALMAWFRDEGVDDDREIKEQLSRITGEKVSSKSLFVRDDNQWDKFQVYTDEVRAERAHGNED